ncbi:MAG: SoxR reducing system RseC family protein [Spirochaetales bacterium]|nr:SoxR reducing system RseC family protein [Spirochaetales bacterium]
MLEVVTVHDVRGKDRIRVSCSSAACNGCKGGLFCNTKKRVFDVSNVDGLAIRKGDRVEIHLETRRTIGGTLLTLIAPLLLFPLGYHIAKGLGAGEGLSTLIALGSIALGFVGVWIYFKVNEHSYLPTVRRVVEEAE